MKHVKFIFSHLFSLFIAILVGCLIFLVLAQLINVETKLYKVEDIEALVEQDIYYVAENQQQQGQQSDQTQQQSSHAAMSLEPIKVPDVPTFDSSFEVEFDNQDIQIHVQAVPSPSISVTDIDAMFAQEIGAGKDLIPIVKVQPIYPKQAKFRKIEGWVETEFVVNREGKVSNVKILRAWPEGYFEVTTLKAVKNWRFKPIQENNKVVSKTIRQLIEFKL